MLHVTTCTPVEVGVIQEFSERKQFEDITVQSRAQEGRLKGIAVTKTFCIGMWAEMGGVHLVLTKTIYCRGGVRTVLVQVSLCVNSSTERCTTSDVLCGSFVVTEKIK